ncbi:MAG: hypothetical protein ACYC61_32930 [Isosphaeraceae bacterium]
MAGGPRAGAEWIDEAALAFIAKAGSRGPSIVARGTRESLFARPARRGGDEARGPG